MSLKYKTTYVGAKDKDHPKGRAKMTLVDSESLTVECLERALPVYQEAVARAVGDAKAACPVGPEPLSKGRRKHTRDTITGKAKINKKNTRLYAYLKTNSGRGLFIENGTVDTPARPFLRPARTNAMNRIKSNIQGVMNRGT